MEDLILDLGASVFEQFLYDKVTKFVVHELEEEILPRIMILLHQHIRNCSLVFLVGVHNRLLRDMTSTLGQTQRNKILLENLIQHFSLFFGSVAK